MTLVHMEGFDTFADDVSDTDLQLAGYRLSGGMLISSSVPRFAGSRYLEVGSSAQIRKDITTTDNISVGFAFRTNGVGGASGTSIFEFQTAADVLLCMLGLDSNMALRFGRGDFTTNNIATSANNVIVANTWHYIEIELIRSATVGVVRVWVDGIQVITTAASQNTGATIIGVTSFRGIVFGLFDDFYICNTATEHKGDCKIETLMPNADTATKDFTRSTGVDNFALVDEKPENGDTDYVIAATVGNKDLYDCANLSSTPLTIHAVQTEMVARKDDATVRAARVNLKSSATTSNGATKAMATTYTISRNLLLTDPNGAIAWTAAAVNAAQIGPEIVT